jgi:hypothetical protein
MALISLETAQAQTAQAVFAKAAKSIVRVEATDDRQAIVARGTGTVVATAEVLTNCHVIDKGAAAQVRTLEAAQEAPIPSEIIGRSDEHDLCLLRAPGMRALPVELGAAATLLVGDPVYAIGSPKGLDLSISDGIVAQLRGDRQAPVIQTTAPISPGSSGGGLFDGRGRLVGITTFYVEGGQNLNFAVAIERLAELRSKAHRSVTVSARPIEELPDLVLANQGKSGDSYLLTRTVKRTPEGLLRAWQLFDAYAPMTFRSTSSTPISSIKAFYEFDCARDTTRMLAVVTYSDRMGRGDIVEKMESADRQASVVVPDTAGHAIFRLVCRIGTQNPQ